MNVRSVIVKTDMIYFYIFKIDKQIQAIAYSVYNQCFTKANLLHAATMSIDKTFPSQVFTPH